MRAVLIYTVFLGLIIFSGCTLDGSKTSGSSGIRMTTLELRDYQTSTFETNDLNTVTKVILDVLRDDGFVIGAYDRDLGIINASKIVNYDNREAEREAFKEFGVDLKADKRITVEFNATVTPFGMSSKVRTGFRINIVRKSGQVKNTAVVTQPEYYRNFFRKVQKGLFLEAQHL